MRAVWPAAEMQSAELAAEMRPDIWDASMRLAEKAAPVARIMSIRAESFSNGAASNGAAAGHQEDQGQGFAAGPPPQQATVVKGCRYGPVDGISGGSCNGSTATTWPPPPSPPLVANISRSRPTAAPNLVDPGLR